MVTGASSGMGRAIAEALSKLGVNLALVARNEEKLREVADMCSANGVNVHIIKADMSNPDQVDTAARKISYLFDNKINYLINCAGVTEENESVDKADFEQWQNTLMVNLVNTMRLTQRLTPYIKDCKNDAAIITIGSMSGEKETPGKAAYGASKHGIRGFSKTLFEELRENGVKVSLIEPGYVNTPMVTPHHELDKTKMIQVGDIVDTVMYILNSKPTCCPIEIQLKPQRKP